MDGSRQKKTNSVASAVAAVRQAWLEAVRAADVDRLASLVTDDVLVVHGNGRCVSGREELKADFRQGFEAFSIDHDISNIEVVVRGKWAMEIAEVASTITPRRGGEVMQVHSTTVVALRRQPDGSWKVGRVLGLV